MRKRLTFHMQRPVTKSTALPPQRIIKSPGDERESGADGGATLRGLTCPPLGGTQLPVTKSTPMPAAPQAKTNWLFLWPMFILPELFLTRGTAVRPPTAHPDTMKLVKKSRVCIAIVILTVLITFAPFSKAIHDACRLDIMTSARSG
jgi:hypothetical protein